MSENSQAFEKYLSTDGRVSAEYRFSEKWQHFPAVILTNLPALIGYYPDSHLCLFGMHSAYNPVTCSYKPVLGPVGVLRLTDNPITASDLSGMFEVWDELQVRFVFIAIVDKRWPDDKGFETQYHLEQVKQALQGKGMKVVDSVGCQQIKSGIAVVAADGRVVGNIGETTRCGAAQLAFETGEIIFASEDELISRFERDHEAPFEQQEIIDRAVEFISDPNRPLNGPRHGVSEEHIRCLTQKFRELIRNLDSGSTTLDEIFSDYDSTVLLGQFLHNLVLRDISLSLIDGEFNATARQLWLRSAQLFDGELRWNALACYAVERLQMGAGGIAMKALRTVERENATHSFTKLLLMAITHDVKSQCLEAIKSAVRELEIKYC